MKTMSVRELQKQVRHCVDAAQQDRVIITRRGRPAAVLLGVEGADWETVVVETDPKFWRLIHARRAQPTISLRALKRRINRRRPSSRSRS